MAGRRVAHVVLLLALLVLLIFPKPADNFHFYYVVLAALVATYLLLRVLLSSPFGHAIRGINANEHRMRALGFATFRYKLAAFAIAGALAGLAGYLDAAQFGFVNP